MARKQRESSPSSCWILDSKPKKKPKPIAIESSRSEMGDLGGNPKRRKNNDDDNNEGLKSGGNCAESPNTSPSFFKVMIGDFKNILFIPPSFTCHIVDLVKQYVSLRDSDGCSWKVKVSVRNGALAFQKGWHDFVCDHSITVGEFVIFTYERNVFDVQIYGTHACKRTHFDEKRKNGGTEAKRKTTEFHRENSRACKRKKTYTEASEYIVKVGNCDQPKKAMKEKSCSKMGKHVIHGENEASNKTEKCNIGKNESSTKRKKEMITSKPGINVNHGAKKVPNNIERASELLKKTNLEKGCSKTNHAIYEEKKLPSMPERAAIYKCKVAKLDPVKKGKKGKSSSHKEKKFPNTVERATERARDCFMPPTPFTSDYNHVIEEDAWDNEEEEISPLPLCIIPCDTVNKEGDNEFNCTGFSSEQLCYKRGPDNQIVLREVERKFLLTENGECHIFDEHLMQEIGPSMLTSNAMLPSEKKSNINQEDKASTFRELSLRHENVPDLTNGETKNCRSSSKKVDTKPQTTGIPPRGFISKVDNAPVVTKGGSAPPKMSNIQNHQKYPHFMERQSHQSGRVANREYLKSKVLPFLKVEPMHVKVERKDAEDLEKKDAKKGMPFHIKLERKDVEDLSRPAIADFKFSFSLTDQTSWVVLPMKLPFQIEQTKQKRKVILLRDPLMRIWPVLYHEDLKFVGLIGGWEIFARANKLEKGNLCEFEVATGSEFTLQVQISRG